MARMRYVKPEFWTDSKMVRFSPWARLLYIGSWNFAMCEAGHLDDDAMALKLKVLPADPIDADEVLEEIVASGRIVRKTLPDGLTYLHIIKLGNHQKVESRYATRCPYCAAESSDEPEQTPDDPDDLSETLPSLGESPQTPQDSAQEGIGGDRKGKKTKSTTAAKSQRHTAPPDSGPETEGQRINRLTRTYTDRESMSSFHAVRGVVEKAAKARDGTRLRYTDDHITAGLDRLIEEGRSVTAATLRIAIEGPPRSTAPAQRASPREQGYSEASAIAAELRAMETPDQLALEGGVR